jgi:hypothetical protein
MCYDLALGGLDYKKGRLFEYEGSNRFEMAAGPCDRCGSINCTWSQDADSSFVHEFCRECHYLCGDEE